MADDKLDEPILDVDELRAELNEAHSGEDDFELSDLPPTMQAQLRLDGIGTLEELRDAKTDGS